ncbi:MAG: hypoxanthine phosphoribosyltransferase [Clostridiales bacterium]|nr:hypoxanthine phosphoribosyltransferase [Clostridiales bacterium]
MDKFDLLISEEEISSKVKEVAAKISADYEGESVVVIGVLTGAFIFTADLVRALTVPVETIDFIQLSSYKGDKSTGNFVFKKDISTDINGKNILIVEDIVDTGRTLKKLREMLTMREPKSIKICTAFDKPSRRVNELVPDYNCFTIPDEFIVGYGLDYDGKYREFKDVRIVRTEDEQ